VRRPPIAQQHTGRTHCSTLSLTIWIEACRESAAFGAVYNHHMSSVDPALYKWILGANDRREPLGLPPGLIEDSIAFLRDRLGCEYLDLLLVAGSEPISVFDPDVNPLKMWLKSTALDQHIVQVLELAAYFRAFKDDSALDDKIEKLKRDRFWPIFFELAMAARMKTACQSSQFVALNPELPDSIGDFVISVGGTNTPCECSRLGHSPQVNEPHILAESLATRIGDATKRIRVPLIFKVRSAEPMTGKIYNLTLRLLRKCLADIKRSRLPTVYYEGHTSICCGELTAYSERIPFRLINEVVTNVDGTDWNMAHSLKRVPAANEEEVSERFKAGERFQEFEAVRLFMKFGPPSEGPDEYHRLANKLRKKLKQTKVNTANYGKLLFIEVPFNLRLVDKAKLNRAISEAVKHSRTTLGVVLANREANPHYRHHYSLYGSLNTIAFALKPEMISIFDRFGSTDTQTDPITGFPYHSSWQDTPSQVNKKGHG
jgi:hypothetical protein